METWIAQILNLIKNSYKDVMLGESKEIVNILTVMLDYSRNISQADKIISNFKNNHETYKEITDNNIHFILALIYLEGMGCNTDFERAMKYLNEGVKQGNSHSMFALGMIFKKGWGVIPSNRKIMIDNFRLASIKGNPLAQEQLALCYLNGNFIKKDLKLALELLNKAADHGLDTAAYELGKYYEEQMDAKSAKQYYLLAIKKGNRDALNKYLNYVKRYQIGDVGITGVSQIDEIVKSLLDELEKTENMRALYELCLLYEVGGGIKKNAEKANQLFNKIIFQADTSELINIGLEARSKQSNKSVALFEQAIKQGSDIALRFLAECYEAGAGTEKNIKKAIDFFEQARAKGDIIAVNALRAYYEEVEGEQAKAEEYFQEILKKGNGYELYELGNKCYDGQNKNLMEAIRFYEVALVKGQEQNSILLGRLIKLYEGEIGLPKNKSKADALLKRVLESSDKLLQISLAPLYADERTITVYNKAASNNGEIKALVLMGKCYEQGKIIKKDISMAMAFYEMGAEKGCVNSMDALSFLYEYGVIDNKLDLKKANELLQQALKKGTAEELEYLGDKYYNATDNYQRDFARAFTFYEAAAKDGDIIVLEKLADCYKKGNGVLKDLKKACEYYQKAADGGNISALNKLSLCYAVSEASVHDSKKSDELFIQILKLGTVKELANIVDYYEGVWCRSISFSLKYDRLYALYREILNKGGNVNNIIHLLRINCHHLDALGESKEEIEIFNSKLKENQKYTDKIITYGTLVHVKKLVEMYSKFNLYPPSIDSDNSRKIYDKVLKEGDADSLHFFASAYQSGVGVLKDKKIAMDLYKQAASKNSVEALSALIYSNVQLLDSDEMSVEYKKNNETFKSIATADQLKKLADKFKNSKIKYRDTLKNMAEYYELAAKRGNIDALKELIRCYQIGEGVKVNSEKAELLFELFFTKADPKSLCALGSCYLNSLQGFSEDLLKAIKLYKEAARKGESSSKITLFGIATNYRFGRPTKRNIKCAFELYETLRELGHIMALETLREAYEHGFTVKKDIKQAVELRKAVLEKASAAQLLELSRLYGGFTSSSYFVVNTKTAVEFIEAAATNNPDAETLREIGHWYQLGQYVDKNEKKAAEFYERASLKGDIEALELLGVFYQNGIGLVKNENKAAEIFKKVLIQGDENDLDSLALVQSLSGFRYFPRQINRAIELLQATEDKSGIVNSYLLDCINKKEGSDKEALRLALIEKLMKIRNYSPLNYIAYLYLTGREGFPKNIQRAASIFSTTGREDKYINGLVIEAHLLIKGDINKRDTKFALECYEIAAKKRDMFVLHELSVLFEVGTDEIRKSVDRANIYFNKILQYGSKEDLRHIGSYYKTGYRDCPKNLERAVILYQAAAEFGDVLALAVLADWYENGDASPYIKIDKDKAASLFKQVIIEGSCRELTKIAEDYNLGLRHFERNPDKAEIFYQAAFQKEGILDLDYKWVNREERREKIFWERLIKEKNSDLLYAMAIKYQDGLDGLPKDLYRAAELFKLALSSNTSSFFKRELKYLIEIANVFLLGTEGQKNIKMAVELFQIALDEGSEIAEKIVQENPILQYYLNQAVVQSYSQQIKQMKENLRDQKNEFMEYVEMLNHLKLNEPRIWQEPLNNRNTNMLVQLVQAGVNPKAVSFINYAEETIIMNYRAELEARGAIFSLEALKKSCIEWSSASTIKDQNAQNYCERLANGLEQLLKSWKNQKLQSENKIIYEMLQKQAQQDILEYDKKLFSSTINGYIKDNIESQKKVEVNHWQTGDHTGYADNQELIDYLNQIWNNDTLEDSSIFSLLKEKQHELFYQALKWNNLPSKEQQDIMGLLHDKLSGLKNAKTHIQKGDVLYELSLAVQSGVSDLIKKWIESGQKIPEETQRFYRQSLENILEQWRKNTLESALEDTMKTILKPLIARSNYFDFFKKPAIKYCVKHYSRSHSFIYVSVCNWIMIRDYKISELQLAALALVEDWKKERLRPEDSKQLDSILHKEWKGYLIKLKYIVDPYLQIARFEAVEKEIAELRVIKANTVDVGSENKLLFSKLAAKPAIDKLPSGIYLSSAATSSEK
jgi:TPR repeat protein